MKHGVWKIHSCDDNAAHALARQLGISRLTARLLCVRGQDTPEKARAFLDSGADFHDPFLLPDMDRAVARINTALERGERVCVYGDYDVDGVTATTLLYRYLSDRGLKCSYFIPERMTEGYGLNIGAIENIAKESDLLITVDTGITAVHEVAYARSLGLSVIVTDHHSCRPDLPEAEAVIDPHRPDSCYPFRNLAGVGVVFKLVCALEGDDEAVCNQYGELVALGTVADVMPVIDENRRIISDGIAAIAGTHNVGLRALMECAGLIKNSQPVRKLNSTSVGFVIAPRINAAGRLGSAASAVELLLETDERRARLIASELCEANRLRQRTESEIFAQAVKMIDDMGVQNDDVIILGSEGWHQGVIGIVASRLSERYHSPAILISFDGEKGKGSGRSIKGFNLVEALAHCADVLEEYGGHELAAGLGIEREKLDRFRTAINEYVRGRLDRSQAMVIEADAEATLDEVTLKQVRELERLEPFGQQNPAPMLIVRDVCIDSVVPVSGGKHTKLIFKAPQGPVTAMCFNEETSSFPYIRGEKCDVMFTMEENEYNGVSAVQMLVRDIRPCRAVLEELAEGVREYQERFSRPVRLPDVENFRDVYRLLRRVHTLDLRAAAVRFQSHGEHIGYCRLRIILDVLEERQLIECRYEDEKVSVGFRHSEGKVNLEDSSIMRRLRGGACVG